METPLRDSERPTKNVERLLSSHRVAAFYFVLELNRKCCVHLSLPRVGCLPTEFPAIRAEKIQTDDVNLPRNQASLPIGSLHEIQLKTSTLSAILAQTKIILFLSGDSGCTRRDAAVFAAYVHLENVRV